MVHIIEDLFPVVLAKNLELKQNHHKYFDEVLPNLQLTLEGVLDLRIRHDLDILWNGAGGEKLLDELPKTNTKKKRDEKRDQKR